MSWSFDTVDLIDPSPLTPRIVGSDVFEITIVCFTNNHDDIDDLNAKAGLCRKTTLLSGKTSVQTTGIKGDLVLGADTYTNCAIEDGIAVEEMGGTGGTLWKYTTKFVRDTS